MTELTNGQAGIMSISSEFLEFDHLKQYTFSIKDSIMEEVVVFLQCNLVSCSIVYSYRQLFVTYMIC